MQEIRSLLLTLGVTGLKAMGAITGVVRDWFYVWSCNLDSTQA